MNLIKSYYFKLRKEKSILTSNEKLCTKKNALDATKSIDLQTKWKWQWNRDIWEKKTHIFTKHFIEFANIFMLYLEVNVHSILFQQILISLFSKALYGFSHTRKPSVWWALQTSMYWIILWIVHLFKLFSKKNSHSILSKV